jgi:hypothetical protein
MSAYIKDIGPSGDERMSTEIVVALISGAVSLGAAGIAIFSNRGVARLGSELEERRRLASKREQAEELRARYRDPLLGTVFGLQSRLYNVVAQNFLVRYMQGDQSSREYAVDNTLHLLAEYLAWVEIIRREIQFLDLGGEVANREWLNALEDVRDVLARDDLDPVLRVFRGEQRAIGEMATVELKDAPDGRRHESLGYARFVECRHAADFNRWFHKLEADLELLAAEPHTHLERVTLLQSRLIDVLDIFDPDCERFPAERRTRLPSRSRLDGQIPTERI